jgi:hypothetical protein
MSSLTGSGWVGTSQSTEHFEIGLKEEGRPEAVPWPHPRHYYDAADSKDRLRCALLAPLRVLCVCVCVCVCRRVGGSAYWPPPPPPPMPGTPTPSLPPTSERYDIAVETRRLQANCTRVCKAVVKALEQGLEGTDDMWPQQWGNDHTSDRSAWHSLQQVAWDPGLWHSFRGSVRR